MARAPDVTAPLFNIQMATLNADHLNFGPLTFDSENDFKKEDRCFYKNAKQIHPIELFKFALKYFKGDNYLMNLSNNKIEFRSTCKCFTYT